MTDVQCDRCGEIFQFNRRHTEISRRNFDEKPQPKVVEYLCGTCLDEYEMFLEG